MNSEITLIIIVLANVFSLAISYTIDEKALTWFNILNKLVQLRMTLHNGIYKPELGP